MPKQIPKFIIGTVIALFAAVGGFWGFRSGMMDGMETVRLSKTKAKMHDATCIFVADFQLESAVDQGAFAFYSETIRAEIIEAMRTKSKYMIVSPQAQKGLRLQFANVANRVAGKRIATNVTFDQFSIE